MIKDFHGKYANSFQHVKSFQCQNLKSQKPQLFKNKQCKKQDNFLKGIEVLINSIFIDKNQNIVKLCGLNALKFDIMVIT